MLHSRLDIPRYPDILPEFEFHEHSSPNTQFSISTLSIFQQFITEERSFLHPQFRTEKRNFLNPGILFLQNMMIVFLFKYISGFNLDFLFIINSFEHFFAFMSFFHIYLSNFWTNKLFSALFTVVFEWKFVWIVWIVRTNYKSTKKVHKYKSTQNSVILRATVSRFCMEVHMHRPTKWESTKVKK